MNFFSKKHTIFLCLASCLYISSCTSFMAATNDGAVSEDYGKRTMGTVLEDSSIESKAKINISRYNEILNNANINVTSYNRIILLTGQVPDIESKNQAGLVAEKVRNVRSVHNELEILPVNLSVKSAFVDVHNYDEAKHFVQSIIGQDQKTLKLF